MATNTTRLALRKPAATDQVNVTTDLADNYDKVDAAVGFTICTSGTRPSSPYQGQGIFETDTGKAYVRSSSSWLEITYAAPSGDFVGGLRVGKKTANQTVTSSTTLVAATGMSLSVVANGVYVVDGFFRYFADGAADIKIGCTVPSGAGFFGHVGGLVPGASGIGGDWAGSNGLITEASAAVLGGAASFDFAHLRGLLTVGVNAGTFEMTFAQAASSATGTIVYATSHIRLQRIA